MFGLGKKNALIDARATSIATQFAERFPPAIEGDPTRKKVQEKLAKALDFARTQALAFQREEGLGVYGKARFFAALKSDLRQAGYSDVFVESTVSSLVTYVGNQGRR